jgi:hypothetical protein
VFAGANYYPAGRVEDLKGNFDTLQECMAFIEGWHKDYGHGRDWWQIVDHEFMTIVEEGNF